MGRPVDLVEPIQGWAIPVWDEGNDIWQLRRALAAPGYKLFIGRQSSFTNVFGDAVMEIDTRNWDNGTSAISIISDGTNIGSLISAHLPNNASNFVYMSHGNPWYLVSNDNDPYSEVGFTTAVSRGSASMAARFLVCGGLAGDDGYSKNYGRLVAAPFSGSQTKDVFVAGPSTYNAIADSGTKWVRVTSAGALVATQAFQHQGSTLGVFNTTPTTKQTVTGAHGSNAALQSLLTALAAYGLIVDSSS